MITSGNVTSILNDMQIRAENSDGILTVTETHSSVQGQITETIVLQHIKNSNNWEIRNRYPSTIFPSYE